MEIREREKSKKPEKIAFFDADYRVSSSRAAGTFTRRRFKRLLHCYTSSYNIIIIIHGLYILHRQ